MLCRSHLTAAVAQSWTEVHKHHLLADAMHRHCSPGSKERHSPVSVHSRGLTRDEASAGITAVKEAGVQALFTVQDWRAQYAVLRKHLPRKLA